MRLNTFGPPLAIRTRPATRRSRIRLPLLGLLVAALVLLAMGPLADGAFASHFRHGNLNWAKKSGAPAGSQRITVQYEQSWRRSAFSNQSGQPPVRGDIIANSEGCIDWGDGTTRTCPQYLVEFVNAAEDYMRIQALAPGSQTDINVPHDYADPSGTFTIRTGSCCTISTLQNAGDASWNILSTVNLAGDNESAIATVPAIVTLAPGGVRSFTVPAGDVGRQRLSFRLSDANESCAGCATPHPPGLTIDPNSGQVTFDTTDKSGLYWTGVVIESRNAAGAVVATSHIQYIIRVGTGGSSTQAPVWTAPTPADGSVFTVSPGGTVAFTLRASDPDPGDSVSILQNSGPGTFTPTEGNPATGSYSFTPTSADLDTDHIVQFIAQDQDGAGPPFRSYTIRVRRPTTAPVDTTPPQTTITQGPVGRTTDDRPTFAFSSNEPGSTFQCSIDGGPFFACSSPYTLPTLSPGAHTFQVRAIDRAGNIDPTPATTVGADGYPLPFIVVAGPVARPVLGVRFTAKAVDGEVFVSVPRSSGARASARVPGLKGRRFVPLTRLRSLPMGSLLDTRRGRVRLRTARNAAGATQAGEFSGGVFQVLQSRRRARRGLTDLPMKGASFRPCRRAGRSAVRGPDASIARRRASRRTIRRLRGNARGRFRTRGRYSSATVRGTLWGIADRCDGTVTRVRRGTIAVRDFRRKKTIVLRPGRGYVARPRR